MKNIKEILQQVEKLNNDTDDMNISISINQKTNKCWVLYNGVRYRYKNGQFVEGEKLRVTERKYEDLKSFY